MNGPALPRTSLTSRNWASRQAVSSASSAARSEGGSSRTTAEVGRGGGLPSIAASIAATSLASSAGTSSTSDDDVGGEDVDGDVLPSVPPRAAGGAPPLRGLGRPARMGGRHGRADRAAAEARVEGEPRAGVQRARIDDMGNRRLPMPSRGAECTGGREAPRM